MLRLGIDAMKESFWRFKYWWKFNLRLEYNWIYRMMFILQFDYLFRECCIWKSRYAIWI